MRLVLLIFLSSLAVLVKSQGESCTTHNKLRGECIILPSCNSLISLYRQDRSENTINILRENQKSCGTRKVGKNPLMCCSDGVPQQVAPPVNQNNGPPCRTPDNLNGFCINVKQCPIILNTFLQRQKDPEYVQYIRNSNARCEYLKYFAQTICCPNDAPPATQPPPPPQSTPATLSTRSQLFAPPQCGISKVPHNRVVGGAPAKKGG
ncbi:phenoloxidase-activating enzyme-like [Chironomus tepperi]|uniref:phenoloxidase-activating enzyme-like n=1 Tax=Chironomus tepperi TaxID=113505 RepID=UPI00391F63DE